MMLSMVNVCKRFRDLTRSRLKLRLRFTEFPALIGMLKHEHLHDCVQHVYERHHCNTKIIFGIQYAANISKNEQLIEHLPTFLTFLRVLEKFIGNLRISLQWLNDHDSIILTINCYCSNLEIWN